MAEEVCLHVPYDGTFGGLGAGASGAWGGLGGEGQGYSAARVSHMKGAAVRQLAPAQPYLISVLAVT